MVSKTGAFKTVFRKIRGRIIPIRVSQDVKDLGAFFGATTAATIGAQKLRQKSAEKFRGKNKTSFGTLPNIAIEVGLTTGALTLAAKKYKSIGRGYEFVARAVKRGR